MKKIYLTLLALTALCTTNATERMWIFYNGFTFPVDYSTTASTNTEIYNTVKSVPLDETSWTASVCASSCSQALELCKNHKMSSAAKADQTGVYVEFGARFQLDGFTTAVVPPAIPTENYLAFNVIGNAVITIHLNPKDAVAKTLNVVNSSGTVVNTITTSALSYITNPYAEIVTVNYTGPATKLTIYPTYSRSFNLSCLFIYGIKVVDSPPTGFTESETTIALKKVGSQLQNDGAVSVEIYTMLGTKVLSSSETSIDISALASGIYIARTPIGSMKFIK